MDPDRKPTYHERSGMDRSQLHRRPARDGAREQALRLVQRAAEACLRLHRPDDLEALHDFRVGVRRLRTFLRAYGAILDPGKKALKGLKRLAKSTNETRDLEVGIEWLGAQRDRLTSRERVGLSWMLGRGEAQKEEAYKRVREGVPRRWARVEGRLRRRLSFPFTGELTPGTFGQVSAGLIVSAAARLEQRLAQIASSEDAEPLHGARICAKQLRYLVEPFRAAVPQAKAVVRELRRFQDIFGELNDAHVMLPRLGEAAELAAAERSARLFELALRNDVDPRELRAARQRNEQTGLLRLARIARSTQAELFGGIEERYLDGRAGGLLEAVREVAAALAAADPAPPGPAEPDPARAGDGV
jgi:CHAD domain-containing protein